MLTWKEYFVPLAALESSRTRYDELGEITIWRGTRWVKNLTDSSLN